MIRTIPSRAVAAIVGAGVLCLAAGVRVPAENGPRQPDAKHGAEIAARGTSRVPACAQCHAFSGVSDSSGAFPMIAGQSTDYLAKQMRDFTTSDRANAIMSPIAKALSVDDIADVSEYYASNSVQFMPLAAADAAIVAKGRQLARVGDATKGIQACNNCHGPDGAGIPPAIPYLAGQYAQYVAFELQMWKRDFRKSSPDAMVLIAKQLD